jgi:hypothetical protein
MGTECEVGGAVRGVSLEVEESGLWWSERVFVDLVAEFTR